jgi:hypothetical protein
MILNINVTKYKHHEVNFYQYSDQVAYLQADVVSILKTVFIQPLASALCLAFEGITYPNDKYLLASLK